MLNPLNTSANDCKEKMPIPFWQQPIFRSIINTIPDYLFIKDEESNILEVNDAFADAFGMKREALLGQGVYSVCTPEIKKIVIRTDKEAFKNDSSELYNNVYFPALGHRKVHTKKIVMLDETGRRCLLCVTRDVTLLQEKEEEIKHAHSFLKKIIDEIPDLIFVKDKDLRLCLVNKAFLGLYNLPEECILGKTTVEDYPKAQADAFIEQDQIALIGGFSETNETITGPGAHTSIYHTKKIGFNSRQGERFLLGISQNITQQTHTADFLDKIYRLTTEAGLTTADKIKNILKASLDYFELDTGIVSQINNNKYLIEYIQSSGDELKPGTEFALEDTYCYTVYNADEVKTYHKASESEIKTHPCYEKFKLESYIGASICLDGEKYGTVNFSSHKERKPFSDTEISFVGLISHWISNELTRYNAHLQLENYAKKLEQRTQEQEEFAHIASHDLKQPLRGISIYAEVLVEDYADKLDEEGAKKLNKISELIQRMETVTDSLLHYSRLTQGELKTQPVDLNKLIDSIKGRLYITLETENAAIEVPDPLPIVYCDPVKIEEVIFNLVINGIKYNTAHRKIIKIGTQQLSQEGESIQAIFVEDNGIGVDKSYESEIFKPFSRFHSSDQFGKGTGYGLNIAKKIITDHNGSMWLQSEVGKGSCFYFTLNVKK